MSSGGLAPTPVFIFLSVSYEKPESQGANPGEKGPRTAGEDRTQGRLTGTRRVCDYLCPSGILLLSVYGAPNSGQGGWETCLFLPSGRSDLNHPEQLAPPPCDASGPSASHHSCCFANPPAAQTSDGYREPLQEPRRGDGLEGRVHLPTFVTPSPVTLSSFYFSFNIF